MDAPIRALLDRDPLQSLPIVGFFESYPLEQVFREEDFMLLTGTSDCCWALLSGTSPKGMQAVLQAFDFQTTYFANVEEWMLPFLTAHRPVEWKMTTMRFYLPADRVVDPAAEECFPLKLSDVAYVYRHSAYHEYTSEEYITDRLQRDISAGISRNGKLVGWGLTHDDGSLGFLNVLEPFRKLGLGESLLRSMVVQKQEKRQPVFVNIEPGNHKSINLVQKLGFMQDRLVSWVKVG